MSTELLYLFLTSILLACLWIPYIAGLVMWKGTLQPEEYVTLRDTAGAPNWVRRANRAHVNLVEQFGAFAGLVVVAHLVGVTSPLTTAAASAFFWLRVVHAIVMIAGIAFVRVRTLVYTLAWLALMVYAWEIAAAKLF
jgi:uncharacterized MAPEG superfamily protein